MNHLLRTEDFTELEAALRTADGHLEQNAPEEAFGELRRRPAQPAVAPFLARARRFKTALPPLLYAALERHD